jgi:chromosome segregation ATPase
MEVNDDIKARIEEAAEALYEESGRTDVFPTVEAVRKRCKAGMGDVSAVMKDWRRQRRAAANAPPATVPERVQQALSSAMLGIWNQAQRLASEEVERVQREREDERNDAEQLRIQISKSNEDQEKELSELRERLAAAVAQATALAETAQQQKLDAERRCASFAEQARTAEARAEEIDKRASDLKTALDAAQASNKATNSELETVRAALSKATSELTAAQSRAEADRAAHVEQGRRLKSAEDQAASSAKAATAAREEAAHLRGQCDALRAQYSALLDKLKPSKAEKPPAKGGKK